MMKIIFILIPYFLTGQIIVNNDYETSLLELDSNKYSFVEFWASWCKPCMESLVTIEKIEPKYKADIEFVLINSHDTKEKVNAIKSNYTNSSQNIVDSLHLFQTSFDIDMVGTFFIFNKDKSKVWIGYSHILKEEYIRNLINNNEIISIAEDKLTLDTRRDDFSLLINIGNPSKKREVSFGENTVKFKNINLEGLIQFLDEKFEKIYDTSKFPIYFNVEIEHYNHLDDVKDKLLNEIIKHFKVKKTDNKTCIDLNYLLKMEKF